MGDSVPPPRFAGTDLRSVRHVCAFFRSDDEHDQVIVPFVREGLDRGEKVVHVLDPTRHDHHRRRLQAAGIDPLSPEERGQLELRSNVGTYLPDGRFVQERMLELFARLAGGDAERGFPRSRIVCHMDWIARGRVLMDDVLEFEARVNHLWCSHDDVVVCAYDLEQLSGDAAIDLIRTHPMAILGGVMQVNPFFVPPDQFVSELRDRKARPRTRRDAGV